MRFLTCLFTLGFVGSSTLVAVAPPSTSSPHAVPWNCTALSFPANGTVPARVFNLTLHANVTTSVVNSTVDPTSGSLTIDRVTFSLCDEVPILAGLDIPAFVVREVVTTQNETGVTLNRTAVALMPLAESDKAVFSRDDDAGVLYISFTTALEVPNCRNLLFVFNCTGSKNDTNTPMPPPVAHLSPNGATLEFFYQSRAACAGKGNETTPEKPKPTPPKDNDTEKGKSVFGILVIVFLVLFTVYMCTGFTYRRVVMHEVGIQQLPHHKVWVSAGRGIRKTCRYTWDLGALVFRGRARPQI